MKGSTAIRMQAAATFAALACMAGAAMAEPTPPAAAPAAAASPKSVTSPRLYAADCGSIRVGDMAGFSDLGELKGEARNFIVPCFIVVHPKGVLVWDAGLNDALVAEKNGVDHDVFHLEVKKTLASQLQALGITPTDVTHVAFSHMHFDHTGNAAMFTSATWLMNRTELAWALGDPAPFGVSAENLAPAAKKTVKADLFVGDRDVFGDGSVQILAAPGHTPGSAVLMLKLKKAGTVVLSGDLYHTPENHHHHRVPAFNTSRAETLASFDRVDSIVKRSKARLVIQHSPAHFAKLPAFPAYLD
ncbi:MAG: N-acyl homoserine lactonase family protein [Panacagrimonas sp.]|jgi:glyoxylase-like metal-dependent hydrolase (beta-lactamase superfamily II)|nr:N-acyl homoserine lactonase family protein [Panacagrimonas sp.]MCC2659008.1 N-acyl homoserine lactonase family protein [Panacagrimonas sp.]